MPTLLDHLTDDVLYGFEHDGQSNSRPWGHRDLEGFEEAPHLKNPPSGLDLTIQSITPLSTFHGDVGSQSLVTVAENTELSFWIGATLRLHHINHGRTDTVIKKGHAQVVSNGGQQLVVQWLSESPSVLVIGNGAGNFDLSNDRFVATSHGLVTGSVLQFISGNLPTAAVALALNTTYTVANASFGASVTAASPGVVTWTGHKLPEDARVRFTLTTGQLPAPLQLNQDYYVKTVLGVDTFTLSETAGGAAINTTGGFGVHTIYAVDHLQLSGVDLTGAPSAGADLHAKTNRTEARLAGYVVHEAKWYGYDNIKVLTPYQPEQPGAYPAGVPQVPGYDFAGAGVESYEDCGLLLPFAWNEGLDGYGFSGTGATVAGLVVTVAGLDAENKLAGGIAIVGASWARIVSHTATAITVDAWRGGQPAASPTTHAWEAFVPHWRDNPNRVLQGFRYPSNDMQPGGSGGGYLYNRARGQFTSGYKSTSWDVGIISGAINPSGYAQSISRSIGDFLLEPVTVAGVTRPRISRYGLDILGTAGSKNTTTATFDAATDTITWAGHPVTTNMELRISAVAPLPNSVLPGGLAAGTAYYARDVIPGVSFKVAASIGGPAVNITSAGAGPGTTRVTAWTQTIQFDAFVAEGQPVNVFGWDAGAGLGANNFWRAAKVSPAVPKSIVTFDSVLQRVIYQGEHGLQFGSVTAGAIAFKTAGGVMPTGLTDGATFLVIDVFTPNTASPAGASSAVTITNDNPGVVTLVGHGFAAGQPLRFTTTGSVDGLVDGMTYYVVTDTADTFLLAASPGGAAIDTTGSQSGTHTLQRVTITSANPGVVYWPGHGAVAGQPMRFTTTGAVTGLAANTTYYVHTVLSADTFSLKATPAGAAIDTTGAQSGLHTFTKNAITSENPGTVFWVGHGLPVNTPVKFVTGGSVTGLVANTTYFVKTVLDANRFTLSATAGGAAIDTTGAQSGLHFFRALDRHSILKTDSSPATFTDNGSGSIFAYSRGSYIELETIDLPTSGINYAFLLSSPGTTIARSFRRVNHRMGSLVECAWQMANRLGKTMHVLHLGVNSASQFLNPNNNDFGYQGQLGWWDDDYGLSWTPSAEHGLFARWMRLHTHVMPGALKVIGRQPTDWKCLVGFTTQGEGDAIDALGRTLYAETMPAFHAAKRDAWSDLGFNPYGEGAKVPIVHKRITKTPWELSGHYVYYGGLEFDFAGDGEGLVNAAIENFAATDGFAATFNPDPDDDGVLPPEWSKLNGTTPFGFDFGHFNGFYEVKNGKQDADLAIPLIEFAFQFDPGLDAGGVAIANMALALLGESANVTSLDPPDDTPQAKLCAQFVPEVHRQLLQRHPWTFATKRVSPRAVDDVVSTRKFAYAVPPEMLHPTKVLDPEATDESQVRPVRVPGTLQQVPSSAIEPASQPFVIESDRLGNRILRTDQEAPVLVYIDKNIPFERWDPIARQAAVHRLAYLLAGPLVKGKSGAALAAQQLQLSEALLQQAAAQNAEYQQDVRLDRPCDWLP